MYTCLYRVAHLLQSFTARRTRKRRFLENSAELGWKPSACLMRPAKVRVSTWLTTVLTVAGFVFLLENWLVFTKHTGDNDISIVGLRAYSGAGPAPRLQQVAAFRSRLAVIVPTHAGDLKKALASLAKWPQNCHPLTRQHADLVVYYAGEADERVSPALARIAETGGKCFADTKLLLAKLTKKVRMGLVYCRACRVLVLCAQFYGFFSSVVYKSDLFRRKDFYFRKTSL